MQGAWTEERLRRVAHGDREEARAFVQQFQRPVFAVLGRTFPGEPMAVEDLAQETFFKAFRGLTRFDPQGSGSLGSWIVTIASRVALDEARRRARRPRLAPEVETAADDHRPPGGDVSEAVMALTPEARLVVTLRLVHGFSEKEVADALGLEVGTVKSRLSRAKTRLRTLLGDAP
jgi:RNA polymerase sigma-70 factor, ECF subfamily